MVEFSRLVERSQVVRLRQFLDNMYGVGVLFNVGSDGQSKLRRWVLSKEQSAKLVPDGEAKRSYQGAFALELPTFDSMLPQRLSTEHCTYKSPFEEAPHRLDGDVDREGGIDPPWWSLTCCVDCLDESPSLKARDRVVGFCCQANPSKQMVAISKAGSV